MQFLKRLRPLIKSGEITSSVRIWQKPHVKIGNRYKLDEGAIEVTSLEEIRMDDITPKLATESGFAGVLDLLKTAKHGRGSRVFLVRFRYLEETR